MSAANTDVPSLVSTRLPSPVPSAEHDQCPVTEILRRVGDKWSVLVVVLLGQRTYRFNELHRGIDGISQRMLTRTLRGLELDGLVLRTVHPSVPPSVEYSLTPLGSSLLHPLSALADWALRHQLEIAAVRGRPAHGSVGLAGYGLSRSPSGS
ncbi:DNA-binding HxlR family transcriptional regulator [Allocatelliglobosispora scoriae]|uniref:DNA-binding HxlR family transcriptional regulator n=1 Tax=Allocatelliglobosispora scoriae TaxID=643052 RepID=A0A841C616_9ACTN|nr:helix-turn-helix domain-containing protein [Allocatelliglobosispora scoriae]MBB5874522.1 DNA-binding HxlR family transcriptional regulator [Allocatelliglobosispora scoriae]